MGLIDNSIAKLKGFFSNLKQQNKYDFLEEAEKAFDSAPNKATEALRWFREIKKNKKYIYGKKEPKGGRLYWFKYEKPLHEKTLPWWDAEPLVLMSSSFVTIKGERRVLGINFHLLPPLVRVRLFADIWDSHKSTFKRGLNEKEKQPTFQFSIKALENKIGKYGGDFGIRMYAPSRIDKAIEFDTADWVKAVHIPSRRYRKTNLVKLEKEYKAFMKNKKR